MVGMSRSSALLRARVLEGKGEEGREIRWSSSSSSSSTTTTSLLSSRLQAALTVSEGGEALAFTRVWLSGTV